MRFHLTSLSLNQFDSFFLSKMCEEVSLAEFSWLRMLKFTFTVLFLVYWDYGAYLEKFIYFEFRRS